MATICITCFNIQKSFVLRKDFIYGFHTNPRTVSGYSPPACFLTITDNLYQIFYYYEFFCFI
jgi:hypothetical protein